MPATRNTRVHKSHTVSSDLLCSFKGCRRKFRSRSALTKHRQTTHLLPANTTRSDSLPTPEGSNKHPYLCHYQGCLRSFNSKGALTQHFRLQHHSRSVPVTAPLSPFPPEPKTPRVPPVESHSTPITPVFSLQSDNEMTIDHLAMNSPHHDNADFMPAGLGWGSDNSHHDGVHLHSRSSPAIDESSTHLSSKEGNTSELVRQSYHWKINGMFIENHIFYIF